MFWLCCVFVFSVFVEIKFLCWNRCHNTRSNEPNRVCIRPHLAISNHIYPKHPQTCFLRRGMQLIATRLVCLWHQPWGKTADDCRCCQILTEVVMSCHLWKVVPMILAWKKNNLVPPMFHTFYVQIPMTKTTLSPPYFIHYSQMNGIWLKHHPPRFHTFCINVWQQWDNTVPPRLHTFFKNGVFGIFRKDMVPP